MYLQRALVSPAWLQIAIVLAALACSAEVEARQKKPTLMNSCSCACRQESATEVHIANKDFYSASSCSSFSGTQCNVQVNTNVVTQTVSGTWPQTRP